MERSMASTTSQGVATFPLTTTLGTPSISDRRRSSCLRFMVRMASWCPTVARGRRLGRPGIHGHLEPTSGDAVGFDPDEVRLRGRMPREERQLDHLQDVVETIHLEAFTLQHYAPGAARLDVVAIHLEGDPVTNGTGELGPQSGSDDHAAVVDQVVDRKDVGPFVNDHGQ